MVLLVDTVGGRVCLRQEHIEVRDRDENIVTRAELAHLSEILIVGAVGITGPAIEALVNCGIDLTYVATDGEPAARLVPDGSTLPELRLRQYDLLHSQARRLGIAKQMILGKLVNGVRLLSRAQRTAAVNFDLAPLGGKAEMIERATSLDTLRGAEGIAAQHYFHLLKKLVPEQWEFTARQRRPPPDPVNAMLSFGYVVVGQRAAWAVRLARLDLYLGILHEDREGRPSLALDLLEEFRPLVVDATVLKIVRQKMLKPSDFEATEEGGCRMSRAGRAVFLSALETRLAQSFIHPRTGAKVDYRKAMEIQARHLGKVITNEEPTYQPLVLR